MALFTEDSVVIGHRFSVDSPVSRGLVRIRAVQVNYIDLAATENAYTISNVEVSGDTVTWDTLWVDSFGEEYCQSGQMAVIDDGKIASWEWGGPDIACP